jgi:hypothetical protein
VVQSRVPRRLLRYHVWLPLVIGVLTAGIFLVDLLTPMSVIVSMLYAIPIYLTRFLRPLRVVPAFTVLCTVLTFIGWYASSPIGVAWVVTINRLLAVCLIWGTAYLTTQIKVLYGYIRVCSACKKIEEDGRWLAWEVYISRHSEADFTHGMCEDCGLKLYPEAFKKVSRKFFCVM